jgi:hypothetical protein
VKKENFIITVNFLIRLYAIVLLMKILNSQGPRERESLAAEMKQIVQMGVSMGNSLRELALRGDYDALLLLFKKGMGPMT